MPFMTKKTLRLINSALRRNPLPVIATNEGIHGLSLKGRKTRGVLVGITAYGGLSVRQVGNKHPTGFHPKFWKEEKYVSQD